MAWLAGVVAEFAAQVSDVDVDQVLVADPVRAPGPLQELAAAEHHAGPLREGVQQVELQAASSTGRPRRWTSRASGSTVSSPSWRTGAGGWLWAAATLGRRSIARMRAMSSRGENGLVR